MSEPVKVSVTIVTCRWDQHMSECFAALRQQDYPYFDVTIVDNDSPEDIRVLLRQAEPPWRVIYNDSNVGFAAGQNQGMRSSTGEWVLCLNPDVVLTPDFISQLVAAGEAHRDAGSICGKLLRWDPEAAQPKTNVIDSTGMYFTPNMRHLDRGAEETDNGQYDRVQYVFGATGAAVMFRRDFIESVSVEGQFFDEEFFTYREDADLAWRAQLMGWKFLYTPAAVAWHVRRVTPERRSRLPLFVNWHSAKNRFLMRGKNASGWLCWRLFFPVAWRDLMTLGYALFRDWRMISAVFYPVRAFRSIRRKRTIIQSRRKISDRDLVWWFCNTPRATDAEERLSG
jgi:GT2 family glycosyltransferase